MKDRKRKDNLACVSKRFQQRSDFMGLVDAVSLKSRFGGSLLPNTWAQYAFLRKEQLRDASAVAFQKEKDL